MAKCRACDSELFFEEHYICLPCAQKAVAASAPPPDDGTVDFMTAIAAARGGGKRVRMVGREQWFGWKGGFLCAGHNPLWLDDELLDARWEIEQPPPKEYTFAEAVEMMKAGKKMRPAHIESHVGVVVDTVGYCQIFNLNWVDRKWVEVTE